jgi:hypothetical protein
MDEFINRVWKKKHARRSHKRLRCQLEELLTFIDHEELLPKNNVGGRGIRPTVIIWKNSYSNGSEKGSQTQAIFMTILRTLKMLGYNPGRFI